MIKSKKELNFYLQADMMMNRNVFKKDIKMRLKDVVYPDYIMKYLKCLRKLEYQINCGGVLKYYYKIKLYKLGLRLGFSIGTNVLGYGVVIPHYGTIVVGNGNIIGNYSVLHTSTCITEGKKIIGNAFYLSAGAKVIKNITIPDNISVGSNSLLNNSKNITKNSLVVGQPAEKIKDSEAWYIRDGQFYLEKVLKCEELRKKMKIKG